MTVSVPEVDLFDRKYLSQFSTEQVGVVISTAAGATDPDDNAVTATLWNDGETSEGGGQVRSVPAERLAVGTYAMTLTSQDTAVIGTYSVTFTYLLDGQDDSYRLRLQVGAAAPAYDALPVDLKDVVEQVWVRLADLFDSPLGGPHLQVYLQTRFGRNRIAQLMQIAVGRMNTIAQPYQTYTVDRFPVRQWGALLSQALYVEVLKHLRRSYLEQPAVVGTQVSRLDRGTYSDLWAGVLSEEQQDLKLMLDNFKMSNMGLGAVSVLVSGGAYGNWGPVALPGGAGSAAARGYYFGFQRR